MQFHLSEEHQLVSETARSYARQALAPAAAERDQKGIFPQAELKELADLGLLSVTIPEAYGGAGADAVSYSLVIAELARVDPSVAVTVAVTNMVAELIFTHGNNKQKQQYLGAIADGSSLCGAFALSEAQAGSNPAEMQMGAVRHKEGWKLSGTKQWITSGDRAGIMVVWAVTDPAAGSRGISAFLVRGGSPGLSTVRLEDKMGLHGSTTAELVFDEVQVRDEDLLGEQGAGFVLAMKALDGGRIGIASQAVGIAQGALDAAIQYAKQRHQFGVPIIKHQAVASMLADSATALEASRLLTMRAAWTKATGKKHTSEASMAKLFASENALKICDVAIQVHGGFGYTRQARVEQAYRDARAATIYEGTSQIQRIVIARELLKANQSMGGRSG